MQSSSPALRRRPGSRLFLVAGALAAVTLHCVSSMLWAGSTASTARAVSSDARVVRPTRTMSLSSSIVVAAGTTAMQVEGAPAGAEVCFVLSSARRESHPRGSSVGLGCTTADPAGAAAHRTPTPARFPVGTEVRLAATATGEDGVERSNLVSRTVRARGNVLIFLADDLGAERLAMFNPLAQPFTPHGDSAATVPRLQELADSGLRFMAAHSAPNCSPTRAEIMTGRRPWRTGVGTALSDEGRAYLRADEITLPKMLDRRTARAYNHAAVGKWHLSSNKLQGAAAVEQGLSVTDGRANHWGSATNVHGWGSFDGNLHRPENAAFEHDYWNWFRYRGVRGSLTTRAIEPTYTTVSHLRAARAALAGFALSPDRPWVLYVAFNAPHSPFEDPPPALLPSGGGSCRNCSAKSSKYNDMIEAIDTAIGNLVDHLDNDHPAMAANTTVVFMGDNGTPDVPAADIHLDGVVKGTVFHGGTHVPLIVRSPLIPSTSVGGSTDALVDATDFFGTLAEIAGEPLSEAEIARHGLDTRSFVPNLLDPSAPGRDHVVTELFKSAGLREVNTTRQFHQRAIRKGDWKLHVEFRGSDPGQWTEALFDMSAGRESAPPVCTGSAPGSPVPGPGPEPAAAACSAAGGAEAAAYQELRGIESEIRAAIDPLHGHCGDEAMQCPIALPVRVMPVTEEGFTSGEFTEGRSFRLTQAEADRAIGGSLTLRGHRLGYRDGHRVDGAAKKDGKASLKLGSCDWVDLTNDIPSRISEPERHYGGIGGGWRTVRMTLPLPDRCLEEGWNRIQFRFNGTDGTSSGYRILDFNVHAANGAPLLPAEAFLQDDPDQWRPPSSSAGDIAAGQVHFTTRRSLTESPLAPDQMTNAACSDCHAADGRDLEYYSYSNLSIVNRAVFHGLTIDEGEQIATYIRSHPAPRYGRPWNPPYQPGVGTDSRPDAEAWWAAGAGLDAVLDNEDGANARTILDAMFGAGGWGDEVAIKERLRGNHLGPARTINLREIPIAIQLPDWNTWLPEKHPLDLWGKKTYYDCTVPGPLPPAPCWQVKTPEQAYLDARLMLADPVFTPDQIPTVMERIEDATRAWIAHDRTLDMGTEWRTIRSPALDAAMGRGYANDFIKRSLAQWMAVKHWELATEFGLQGQGRTVYPAHGEKLSWPFGNRQAVHAVAPHIVSTNRDHTDPPLAAEIAWQVQEFDPANGGAAGTEVSIYCSDWCFSNDAEIAGCVDSSTGTPQVVAHPDCDAVKRCFQGKTGVCNTTGDSAAPYPEVHAGQTQLKGDYDSTAWYHLQMILHSGARNPSRFGNEPVKPVDWPYSLIHIDDLARDVMQTSGADVFESLRWIATLAKTYQMRDNGRGPGKTGWSMRDVSPRLLIGSYSGYAAHDELWTGLDDIEPGLRIRFGNAFLQAFLEIVDPSDPKFANWPQRTYPNGPHRADEGHSWWMLDPPEVTPNYVGPFESARNDPATPRCPKPLDGVGTGGPHLDPTYKEFRWAGRFDHADQIYRAIPWMTNVGLRPLDVEALAAWAASKWPGHTDRQHTLNDWNDPVRGLNCTRIP